MENNGQQISESEGLKNTRILNNRKMTAESLETECTKKRPATSSRIFTFVFDLSFLLNTLTFRYVSNLLSMFWICLLAFLCDVCTLCQPCVRGKIHKLITLLAMAASGVPSQCPANGEERPPHSPNHHWNPKWEVAAWVPTEYFR
jgi:hypothetical protein